MERKYAMILGNLGNTRDRFCTGYKQNPTTLEMLQQAAQIPYVTGIELVPTPLAAIRGRISLEPSKIAECAGKRAARNAIVGLTV